MTWKLVDDGQTPKEVYNKKIYIPAFFVACGGIVFGFTNSFFGSVLALPSFNSNFGLAGLSAGAFNTLSSNLAVTFQCGCFGACFIAYPFAEIIGRRQALGLFSLIFLLGACLMLASSLGTFYAGRFFTGFGVGPITAIVPLYLAEIAPPALRGRFIGLFEMGYQVGAVIGFWAGYFSSQGVSDTNPAQWRIPVSLQIPLIAIVLIGMPFIPETPRFLCKKGDIPKATRTISKLRQLPEDHAYVQRELNLIQTELAAERAMIGVGPEASSLKLFGKQLSECIKPGIRYRISLGVITQMIGQFSGVNGLNYYSVRIFHSIGVRGNSTSLFATGIFGVVNLCTASVMSLVLVDRLGRRALLLIGGVIMTFSLFYVGAYIKIAQPDPESTAGVNGAGISALAFIYIYLIGFVGSYACVPYILGAEVAPLNVRAASATLSAAAQWLGNLVITKATPYMITDLGYGTFFFFGSCVVLGSTYVWFFVPETRGVPMEELDVIFGMNLVHHADEETARPVAHDGKAVLHREESFKATDGV